MSVFGICQHGLCACCICRHLCADADSLEPQMHALSSASNTHNTHPHTFTHDTHSYIVTSREVKRLEAITRSPVYASFSATLKVGRFKNHVCLPTPSVSTNVICLRAPTLCLHGQQQHDHDHLLTPGFPTIQHFTDCRGCLPFARTAPRSASTTHSRRCSPSMARGGGWRACWLACEAWCLQLLAP